jgi:hypothetical protein
MIAEPTRYQVFEPGIEVSGVSAQALTSSIIHKEIEAILIRHNLNNIDVEAWYPLQDVLDVFNELAAMSNKSDYFVGIGMAVAQNTYNGLPDAMRKLSLIQFLNGYEQIYLTRQRCCENGDKGYLKPEQVDEHHIVVRMRVPYPDDLFYGIMYGLARSFRPAGKGFTVKYDPDLPRREQGATETVIHIRIDH